jgi:Leucine-rich repeat (LRR) protein
MKHYLYTVIILALFSCSKDEPEKPNTPPNSFEVTAKAEGTEVTLTWTEAVDADGDAVTYAVVYGDTLAKGLTARTHTVKNLPYETEISGTVVASDGKGGKTEQGFKVKTEQKTEVPWDDRYVKIPDAAFEMALIQNRIDDVVDGRLLKSRVIGVKQINLESNIRSLSGIEIFEDLESLSISSFILEDERIDLSKNTKMWNLHIMRAPKLKSFDVSNFLNLQYLILTNTSVDNLDLSKNIKLRTLYCFRNKLKGIDIRSNNQISSLEINENEISNLDLSYSNNLVSLNVSDNPLTSLSINDNLTGLDISNTKLNFSIIKYPKGLESLDLSDNNIEKLDLSTLPAALSSLYLNSTNLHEIDLSKLPKNLKTLGLSKNKLKNLDFSNLLSLRELSISDNVLEEINVSKNSLMWLSVDKNKLKSLDIRSSSLLSHLDCNGNQILTICIHPDVKPGFFWTKDASATYKICD